MAELIKKRVLITVRTYPVPATKGVEVSCTAGVTDDGKWIRLFPLPYRLLDDENKFRKYQWINVKSAKARHDSRPESFNPQGKRDRDGQHPFGGEGVGRAVECL